MRRVRDGLTILLVLTVASLAGTRAPAGNWPRFRGPNGTGVAPDNDIPVHWGPEAVLWKAPIPGVGNSSPVVWGGRVFLQSASADGAERWLLCLDAVGGKTLWTRALPGSTARKHPRVSLGPHGSPVV